MNSESKLYLVLTISNNDYYPEDLLEDDDSDSDIESDDDDDLCEEPDDLQDLKLKCEMLMQEKEAIRLQILQYMMIKNNLSKSVAFLNDKTSSTN